LHLSGSPYGRWSSYLACTALGALLFAASPAAGASAAGVRVPEELPPPQHKSGSEPSPRPIRISIYSAHRLRDYYLFVPGSLAPDMPGPVLLLLHGSYSTPLEVLPQWTEVAERAGIILVAPKSFADYGWRIRDDTPALLRAIVDDLAARRPIDRRRIYVFGHSAGGVHALMLGLLESQYFAAVAVHAAAFTQREYFNAIPLARRKIPLWITIGDQDRFFSMKEVTATEAALREAGFPVTLTVIKGHDHSYTTEAGAVNRAAWEFLAPFELAQPPVFTSYE